MSEDFILDLVSAVDYTCDIKAYLKKCESESCSPCNIQYLQDKVDNILRDLNSMMDRLCKGER